MKSKELAHLGIVTAMFKKMGIAKIIDKCLPISKEKGAKLTMSQRVLGLILNAVGFLDTRLYMFTKFLKGKPVDKLIGKGVKEEYFTDDALGRCLDAIYEFGSTNLFSKIVFNVAKNNNLLGKSMHIDTTSLTVYGDYDNVEKPKEAITVTHGYSKDKRPDLKQVVLTLATNNKADLPIFMAGHSGNASDQKVLIKAAKKIDETIKKLGETESFIYVADSAMYESCLSPDNSLLWLSRVPFQRKEAKNFVKNSDQFQFEPIGDTGYKIYTEERKINGIKQRWALVFSEKAYSREIKTLEKKIIQENNNATKALWHLCNKEISCQKDAEKLLKKFSKTLKYHQVTDLTFTAHKKYNKKGKPSKEDKPVDNYVKIKAIVTPNDKAIEEAKKKKGYFILATNQLDASILSDEEMLKEYKGQQKTERGFAFIKDKAFEVSSVFLKKETRIEALLMIMSLALFMYSLTQYHLRQQLLEKDEYVPNQLKKPIKNPTGKWIFFLLRNIQVATVTGLGTAPLKMVINITELGKRIINYYGQEAMEIYGIVPSVQ